MKNNDEPGFKRAERFVKRNAHKFNAKRLPCGDRKSITAINYE